MNFISQIKILILGIVVFLLGVMPMFVHIIAESKLSKLLRRVLIIVYCTIAIGLYVGTIRYALDPKKTEVLAACMGIPILLIWSLFGIWQTKIALKEVDDDALQAKLKRWRKQR